MKTNTLIKTIPQQEEGEPGHQKKRARAYLWELRMLASWTMMLPLLLLAGSVLLTWVLYSLALASYLKVSAAGYASSFMAHKPTLDYTSYMRVLLELLLPLLSLMQVHDVLIREWRRNTIAILTTRRSLYWFFVVRMAGILWYLFLVVALGLVVSWWMTPQETLRHLQESNLGAWFWQAWLTAIAPTIFMMALGLFVCHLTGNTLAGIILPAACLLANCLFALQIQQSNQTNLLISYLFFGWSEQALSSQPDAWLNGKVLLCVIALCLFACQIQLLKRMTIQQKTTE